LQWSQIKTTDLPAINQQLRGAKQPKICPESKPEEDELQSNLDEG
jgi:hypothetical protein